MDYTCSYNAAYNPAYNPLQSVVSLHRGSISAVRLYQVFHDLLMLVTVTPSVVSTQTTTFRSTEQQVSTEYCHSTQPSSNIIDNLPSHQIRSVNLRTNELLVVASIHREIRVSYMVEVSVNRGSGGK